MSFRSFLAVEPDPRAREAVAAVLSSARAALGMTASALRWTPAANLHVTLHFLGELDPPGLRRVLDEIGDGVAEPSFTAELDALGVFPSSGPAKTLWLSVGRGRAELARVHQELGLRLARCEVALESRPFVPHFTLARVRDRERRHARHLTRSLGEIRIPQVRWPVERVTFFKSDLSGPTPRYEIVRQFPLT